MFCLLQSMIFARHWDATVIRLRSLHASMPLPEQLDSLIMHTFSKQSVDLPERQFLQDFFLTTLEFGITEINFVTLNPTTSRYRNFSSNTAIQHLLLEKSLVAMKVNSIQYRGPLQKFLENQVGQIMFWQKIRERGKSNLQLRWQMFQTTPIRTVNLPALQSKPSQL